MKMKHDAWPPIVHVADFVTVRPCVEGDDGRMDFKIWKEQMQCLLECHDLLGFVDGKIKKPSEKCCRVDLKKWRRKDGLVRGWILGSIGRDALNAVWEKPTAKDVWSELEKIFRKDVWSELGKIFRDEIEKQKDEDCDGGTGEKYLQMYKAAWEGDWGAAQNLLTYGNVDANAAVSRNEETALHVAVLRKRKENDEFVKEMVEMMSPAALARKDGNGDTALHNAALVGNKKAAEILVSKDPSLQYVLNDELEELPVVTAAKSRQKETFEYLMSELNVESNAQIFKNKPGVVLICTAISTQFFDVVLDLLDKHSYFALLEGEDGNALVTLANMSSVFRGGLSCSWSWQTLLYLVVPPKQSKDKAARPASVVGDIENTARCDAPACNNYFHSFMEVLKKLEYITWDVMEHLVPQAKEMREKKATHEKAVKLVKILCKKMISQLPEREAWPRFLESILTAAENGIVEIVDEILHSYPMVAFASDKETGRDVFLRAASNRHENVINLLYKVTDGQFQFNDEDCEGNNLMDVCAKLPSSDRLNVVRGSALQMQRELQWFKEMEEFVHPLDKEMKIHGQTSQRLFTKEHHHLKKEGEKWMKDTATACNIAAVLIATVMFSAAFTKPGGDHLDKKYSFALDLFAISDIISLFTSITSLLMFLSILTSRYAEQDFLFLLPGRLTLGLLSLLLSITFMLVAFCAVMYIEYHDKLRWVLTPLATLTCLPLAAFVILQFPLLVDVVYLTYGPGIFRRRNKNKGWISLDFMSLI